MIRIYDSIIDFTEPSERKLAQKGKLAQAAVAWKKRTGASLEEARRMRTVFGSYNLKYWGAK